MNNSNLNEKKGRVVIFFIMYKNEWMRFHWVQLHCENLLSKNKDVILNRAKDYYENDKKKIKGQAKNKYRNLSEEDKNKKTEYGRNRCHNVTKEKKKKD